MQRFIIWTILCLPICLLVAPDRYRPVEMSSSEPTFAVVVDDGHALPGDAEMERLAKENPAAFLEWCIRRCQRDLHSARMILHKHERVNGKERSPEIIAVDYRVAPHAVLFHWKQGGSVASSVLYSAQDMPEKLLVRPVGLLALGGNVERDVRGPEARQSGRYPLDEFGFALSMRRTLTGWRRAARLNALHVEYLGIQQPPELDCRPCFVLRRSRYLLPEDRDGVCELTIFIDCATWLQTGSVLCDAHGQRLGQYFFRAVQMNPPFLPDRFTPKGLTQAPPAGI